MTEAEEEYWLRGKYIEDFNSGIWKLKVALEEKRYQSGQLKSWYGNTKYWPAYYKE